MTFLEILLLLLVAAICGSIAQALAGFSAGGLIVSIALGFVGAVLGSWLYVQLGLREIWVLRFDGVEFPVVWSIIGATLFALLVGLFRRRPVR